MSEVTGVLETLIAALNRNSDLLESAASAANTTGDANTKTTSTKSTRGGKASTTKKTGPSHTKAEATEAIVALKDTVGKDAAVALLKKHGFAKVAEITEDKFDVLFDEATAQVEAAGNDDDGDDI